MSWTIREAIEWGKNWLIESGSTETAQLDTELLLAHQLGQNRTTLRIWPDQKLEPEIATQFRAQIQQCASGQPVAYLIGKQGFWSLNLHVTPDTLIPRPETELLVELALERIPTDTVWDITDLGTGSGAIALAMAKERPNCRIWATDQSVDALKIAQRNAVENRIGNVQFLQGSWFEPFQISQTAQSSKKRKFDLILSNPPYVAVDDPHLVTSIRFEPQSALVSGEEGLDDIEKILANSADYLRPNGQILLEHGFQQGEAVRELFQKNGFSDVFTQQDLAGLDRVTGGIWKDGNP